MASVVPSATDVIADMGAADHLVGVSRYESNPDLARYPRIGDYHGVDWEQFIALKPEILLVQRSRKDMAQAFLDRAQNLKLELVSVHVDRLEEIEPMIRKVGEAVREPEKTQALIDRLNSQLKAVSTQAGGKEPVKTLIVLDKDASFVAGRDNFLEQILTLAGGSNIGRAFDKDYVSIDREKLLALDPEAIIQLLPDAPPQVVEAAKSFWNTVPQLKAVRNGRVYIHTEWFLQLPSARVGAVAQLMANDLHPLTPGPSATTTTAR